MFGLFRERADPSPSPSISYGSLLHDNCPSCCALRQKLTWTPIQIVVKNDPYKGGRKINYFSLNWCLGINLQLRNFGMSEEAIDTTDLVLDKVTTSSPNSFLTLIWSDIIAWTDILNQCCGSGSGSCRIRSFLVTRIRIRENTGSGSCIHKKTPCYSNFLVIKLSKIQFRS